MINKKKIVFIAFGNSIHSSKWISAIDRAKFDVYLISTSIKTHKKLYPYTTIFTTQDIIKHLGFNKFLTYFFKLSSIKNIILNVIFNFKPIIKNFFIHSQVLSELLLKLKPDIVHALEFQHNGYRLNNFKKNNFPNTKFIISNWGSDIFFFKNFLFHKNEIQKCINFYDYYICETKRDLKYYELFNGKGVAQLIPGSLGIYESLLNKRNNNKEKIIIIKGYNDKFGKSLFILRRLIKLKEILDNHQIYILLSNNKVKLFSKFFLKNFKIIHYDKLDYSSTLDLLSRCEIYIGASKSDGLSTMALEALSFGAKVIQGENSCLNEFNFKFYNYSFRDNLEDIITEALRNNDLLFNKNNFDIIKKEFLYDKNKLLLNQFYSKL